MTHELHSPGQMSSAETTKTSWETDVMGMPNMPLEKCPTYLSCVTISFLVLYRTVVQWHGGGRRAAVPFYEPSKSGPVVFLGRPRTTHSPSSCKCLLVEGQHLATGKLDPEAPFYTYKTLTLTANSTC